MRLASLALALAPGLLAKCFPPGPSICQVARSEVVFLGRAVKASPRSEKHAIEIWRRESARKNRGTSQPDDSAPMQTTKFEVLEAYRGARGRHVTLRTEMEFHVGYSFTQGATYLIFADRDEATGALTTTGCRHTQPITGDNPDLATVRQLFAETKRGRLYGYATTDRTQFLFERTNQPAPNVTVTLTSPALTLQRTTAPDGTYDFSFIPAGSYTLTTHLKGQAISLPRQLTIEPQSCSLVPIPVPPHPIPRHLPSPQ
ncbi:MAG: carboxypeptidase regulatory-like domain-containing protein [Bryobacterales bacterium]|nr:carboxypeptidase regulatory-like domain-containing protein [Bryobacterales bacterium]